MKLTAKWLLSMFSVILLLSALLMGCGRSAGKTADSVGKENGTQSELIVFAAASLTESVTEIGKCFEETHPGVHIRCSFDSSGTLKTQIEEGADCDLFLSAAEKQMNELDCILEESRIDLLENRVCLAVPEGNPADLHDFHELADRLEEGNILMVIGNEDVPVGQYSAQLLSSLGLSASELAETGTLTYGSNAKEVATLIREASADCGIIYESDAGSAGLCIIDTAYASMCGQVLYPAAVLKTAAHPVLAAEFLDFLQDEKAGEIFRAAGLTPVDRTKDK